MTRRVTKMAGMFAALAIGTFAQTPPPEAVGCNEEYARFLVDQQVSESRTVEQTDKRVRILIRAAEFVWKYDQPAARAYFTEAFKVARERFVEKGFEKTRKPGFIKFEADHRFTVIRAIGAKDAQWAKALIEQLLKEYEKDKDRDPLERDREMQDTLQVAVESLKTNPELSRTLFRRVMAYPLDFYWMWTLFSVAENDRGFADTLYVELLNNYSNATPRRLLFLSSYPFGSERIFGPDKFSYGTSIPAGFTPNANLQRQFITVFIQRAISFAGDPANLMREGENNNLPEPGYMLSVLAELEPIIVSQFPHLIPRLSEAKGLTSGMMSEQIRNSLASKEQRNRDLVRGFEQRLKDLEDADGEGRLTDQMIVSLVTWSTHKRTEAEFRQIEPWLEKIKDAEARDQTTNYFWFVRSQLAVKERRLDEAQRFAGKIPEIEHRAVLVFQIAEAQLKSVNDMPTVYQTLRDVGRLAEQAETSVEKARVLIALTNQYIAIDSISAMQQLNDAIKVINRIENGDVMSTTVFRQIHTKDSSFFASFSLPGQNLEGTFKAISKQNFELSLSAAKALEDKYLRTLAVLAVAQNCVGKTEKPATLKRTQGPRSKPD